MMTTPKQ